MSFSFNEPTATHPTTEQTKEVDTNVTDTTTGADNNDPGIQGDASNVTTENTRTEDSGIVPEEGEPTDQPDGESKPDGSDSVEAEFYFGETQVEIKIDDEVNDALKEKGLDAMAIAKELYSKDGKFELSEDTKGKLYEAFGKFAVDAYLNGLKAQNEAWMQREAAAIKEAEQANIQRFEDVAKECGGEEGWGKLESWALEHLSDDELAAFNAVMESGNQYLQMYAVRELEGRRKSMQGDDKPNLIEPSKAAAPSEDNSPLSRDQYIREVAKLGSIFGKDRKGAAEAQAKLDARRRAGMAKGL